MTALYNRLAAVSVKYQRLAPVLRSLNRFAHGLNRTWPESATRRDKLVCRLPFDLDIPASTYLDNAMPFSILSRNPAAQALFFTYNVQLFFPHNKQASSEKFTMCPALNREHWAAAGMLIIEEVHDYRKGARRPQDLISDILRWLTEGYYLEFRLNDYFIPGRTAYMLFNILRLNSIVGADTGKGVFFVAGSRDQDSYEVTELNFKDFLSAFYELPASRTIMPQAQLQWWKWLWKWRPLTRPAMRSPGAIDLKQLAAQISDFIEGRDSRNNPDILIPLNVGAKQDGFWGIDACYAFRDYIAMIGQYTHLIDVRATRTLWEHIRCMVARLEALKKHEVAIAAAMVTDFKRLEGIAAEVHGLAQNFNRQNKVMQLQILQRKLDLILKQMVPLMETLYQVLMRAA